MYEWPRKHLMSLLRVLRRDRNVKLSQFSYRKSDTVTIDGISSSLSISEISKASVSCFPTRVNNMQKSSTLPSNVWKNARSTLHMETQQNCKRYSAFALRNFCMLIQYLSARSFRRTSWLFRGRPLTMLRVTFEVLTPPSPLEKCYA